jgi:hypothetical protein
MLTPGRVGGEGKPAATVDLFLPMFIQKARHNLKFD